MGFFENLGNKVSKAGDKIADTARNTSQISNLESAIYQYQRQIDDAFRQLGFMVYQWTKNPEGEEPDYKTLVNTIDELNNAKNAAQEENDRLHGMIRCRYCGATMPVNTRFCPNCGKPVVEEQPQQTGEGEQNNPSQQLCPNCGQPISPEDKFCLNCGTPLQK